MYYTTAEIAKMFKVHPETIKREVSRGNLHGFKVGTEYRFSEQHIAEYSNSLNNIKSKREIELEETIESLKIELQEKSNLINIIKDEILKISVGSSKEGLNE